MSEELSPPSLDPVLRFRLHTLMWVTTVLAVLAAVAGPFYRSMSEHAQTRLLINWGTAIVITGLTFQSHYRTTARRLAEKSVKFVAWQSHKTDSGDHGLGN